MFKYIIVNGQFPCHVCKEVVGSLRMYQESGTITWMCRQKHITKIELIKKRS